MQGWLCTSPGSKSLENRPRFLRRAKARVQGAVEKSSHDRDIRDVLEGGEVSISLDGMNEPFAARAARATLCFDLIEAIGTHIAKADSYRTDSRGRAYAMGFFSAKHLGAGQFYLTARTSMAAGFEFSVHTP
jgi:uncharacterized sporulation protein YeaH/YhbH (DUF444 family)